MSNLAYDLRIAPSGLDAETAPPETHNVPRITIHAFCETPEIAVVLEAASRDRRLARARVSVCAGDVAAATALYGNVVTPDLILLESRATGDRLLLQLDRLAAVCAASTKVVVIGRSNDIALYRALMTRGVSDYLLAPVGEMSVIGAISRLYHGPQARPLGRVIAFIGAKGGAGSSTVAHNVAWSIGHGLGSHVMMADLDLPFGTAGLDFNLDQNAGVAEALQDLDSLDELKLDRLLVKQDDHLSILTAPAELAKFHNLETASFERLVEIARGSVPFLILDLPHVWTDWVRTLLRDADAVVITAEPDLANFKNAKAIIESLQQARPNDAQPKLILNRVGMPKRPEIKTSEFAKALKLEPIAAIPFNPQLFGAAANKGQMIGQASVNSKSAKELIDIAHIVTGREPLVNTSRRGLERLWMASSRPIAARTQHHSLAAGLPQ